MFLPKIIKRVSVWPQKDENAIAKKNKYICFYQRYSRGSVCDLKRTKMPLPRKINIYVSTKDIQEGLCVTSRGRKCNIMPYVGSMSARKCYWRGVKTNHCLSERKFRKVNFKKRSGLQYWNREALSSRDPEFPRDAIEAPELKSRGCRVVLGPESLGFWNTRDLSSAQCNRSTKKLHWFTSFKNQIEFSYDICFWTKNLLW